MTGWRPPVPPPPGGRQPSNQPPRPTGNPSGRQEAYRPGNAEPNGPSDHDPEGMQSVLMRARDQSRFVPPEIEEKRQKRPIPWRNVAMLFAGVIILAIVAGAFYALVLRKPEVDPETIVSPTATDGETVRVRSPQDVVRDYLEALAEGDIDAALSMGQRGGIGSMDLLTEKAHSRMREKAPISNIQIITQDQNATEVEVSYELGGTPVNTVMAVRASDTGGYELERTTVTIIIELGEGASLPLLVNDIEVKKFAPLEVVPGVYELSTGLSFIEYPAENSITIGSLRFRDETQYAATPRLTGAGADALRDAVRRSLDRCITQQHLAPDGCPQSIGAPRPVDESTIRWRLVGNPLAESEPSLSADDLSVGIMPIDLRAIVTFKYADGSDSGENERKIAAIATANMLGKDPKDINIIWRR